MRTPDRRTIDWALGGAISSLGSADARVRPPDSRGRPGGLVLLPVVEYVVIVPDLHARGDFLRAVIRTVVPGGSTTVEADMNAGRAAVVCVGDAFHAEVRAIDRWRIAYREFLRGNVRSPAMDEEMSESLDLLLEVARLQTLYPLHFHFLKGNHENIANEWNDGNFPFRKFALEGEMVREWTLLALGRDLFNRIYRWEKCLPLAARGDRFLVTHAEPVRSYSPDEIVDAYMDPATIVGLTWTDNGQAEPDSVAGTLESFFPGVPGTRIFGGHRPVPDRYALRQDGRYVQINTPGKWVVAVHRSSDGFDAERDIIQLESVQGD